MLRRRCSRLHHGPSRLRCVPVVGSGVPGVTDGRIGGIRGHDLPTTGTSPSHGIVCLTIVCDTQYSVMHERDRSTRDPPAGAAARHGGARVPAPARAARATATDCSRSSARAGSTPTPTRSTPCCAASRSRATSRASGTPTRHGPASSTARAPPAPGWRPRSPTTSTRSPRRSTHCPAPQDRGLT